jgi:hypothetical protein
VDRSPDRDDIDDIDWTGVVRQLRERGWTRLPGAVASDDLADLEQAAPDAWSPSPETEGGAGVRQAGLTSHSPVDAAADIVRSLAERIQKGIDSADSPTPPPPLPAFNHAEWCTADGGRKFITPHRDPDTAGGVVAVVTLRGRAVFRIWDLDGPPTEAEDHPELATTWETEGGDLVVMRSGGWPEPGSRCPIHEAQSPPAGERVTLTLRHNKGGFGADYFP